jgi:hypothetical protein
MDTGIILKNVLIQIQKINATIVNNMDIIQKIVQIREWKRRKRMVVIDVEMLVIFRKIVH